MLKILVIGSGAREHAIVRAINRSPKKKEIHCLATNYNPGITEICNNILVANINDPDLVKNYAKEHKINPSTLMARLEGKQGDRSATRSARQKLFNARKYLF